MSWFSRARVQQWASIQVLSYSLTFLIPFAPSAQADDNPVDTVKIVTIKDETGINLPHDINVNPGDVINLAADILRQGGDCQDPNGCQLQQDLTNFIWSADDAGPGNIDSCDPSDQTINSLDQSNFDVNAYGVSFYVPYSMSDTITITVNYKNTDATDYVVLHNILATQTQEPPPPTAVTDINNYPNQYFSFDYALANQGWWEYMGDTRVFVPYTTDENWQPYLDGTQNDDVNQQLHWVSNDPFGFVTDHYGIWRHTITFGWVWIPFADQQYRPCVATWVYGDNFVGWFPYDSDVPEMYRQTDTDGFDDGYWKGENGWKDFDGSHNHHPGLVIFNPQLFNRFDQYKQFRVSEANSWQYFAFAQGRNSIGKPPGQGSPWLKQKYNVEVPRATFSERQFSNRSVWQPRSPVVAPNRFRPNITTNSRPIPVGSLIRPPAVEAPNRPTYVRPNLGNQGLIYPPRIRDAQTGQVIFKPPRGNVIPQPNPAHPISQPIILPPRPTRPVLQPAQPQPRPLPRPPENPIPRPQNPGQQRPQNNPRPTNSGPRPPTNNPPPSIARPRPQPEPARPQPEPARPQPEPARPQPEPARPQPEPARPQPEPARPQPEPARPQPEPARPQPEPARPQPEPARPQPEPARPQPQPSRPQEPARPQPQPSRPQPEAPRPQGPRPGPRPR